MFASDLPMFASDLLMCAQMDIHSPTVTVAESLMFSARLRLPRTSTDAMVRLSLYHGVHL